MLTINMSHGAQKTQNNHNDSGFVSLIVVAVLAVVLALVALSFSKLMNRETRQALDRELSAQAYYAAQAGLNDARAYLEAGGTGFTTCNDWPSSPVNGNAYFVKDLSNGSGAKYSCLTINESPNSLIYTLKTDQSITFEVSNLSLNRMYFGWENDPKPDNFVPLYGNGSSTGALPKESGLAANAAGLLEINMYPVPSGSTNTSNDTLAGYSRSYYLYPNKGGCSDGSRCNPGSANYGSGSYSPTSGRGGYNGQFVQGNCVTNNSFQIDANVGSNMCNSYIAGLSGSNTYYVRMTARYAPLTITVQPATSTGGTLGGINNTQAVVDITGQGTDVLQRIVARIDISDNVFQTPTYGLQSMMAICKGYRTYVVAPSTYGTSYLESGFDKGDEVCTRQQAPSSSGSTITSGGLGAHR